MKTYFVTSNIQGAVCPKRVGLNLCRVALILALLKMLSGCAAPEVGGQTSEVGRKRAANVARVEKRAWSLGGFLVDLAGKVIVNSATNYVEEKFGGSAGGRTLANDRGFRK
jgi:hypothetical protein